MYESKSQQFNALSDYLAGRREAILLAWRSAAKADPEQTTARSLTRSQFNDHIPEALDAFEHKLRSRPGGGEARAADAEKKEQEIKHGLHRWQQGYRLEEVMHEWGHLQLCLFEELEAFRLSNPEFSYEAMVEANRQLISFVNEAISESTSQYARMQQAEAAGRVEDLEKALTAVQQIERHRATLIRQALHDLRGNVQSVTTAADVLGEKHLTEAERVELAALLQQGVEAVSLMLGELMDLARLEAGQDQRVISTFDVAVLITDMGNANRHVARERDLFLKVEGPSPFAVESDPVKIRRLLQNLLLNALKYTQEGGVTVSWGEEKQSWWLMVKDTGPGILAGPSAPMAVVIQEATESARESDEKAAAQAGEAPHVLTTPEGASTSARAGQQQPGEGIGLSIVKRLCELLDGSLEMASSVESGTSFRIVLPRQYVVAARQ
jgi:signal transduction histidine kinase